MQEAEDKIQMHIGYAIDLEKQNEGREAVLSYLENLYMSREDEEAITVIAVLHDMFNLDLQKLGIDNILI